MFRMTVNKAVVIPIFVIVGWCLAIPAVASETITSQEVVNLTNQERNKRKKPTLAINQQLQTMAEIKARDMIENQYFDHVSPKGVSLKDLADEVGYGYMLVGENLAAGNFGTSAAVVKGWMNSPGHRANILQTKFSEIGVAAVTGTYKGRVVWMVVQEFGRPRAACPAVSNAERDTIASGEAELVALDKELRGLRQAIQSATTGAHYDEAAERFRVRVQQYNANVRVLQAKVADFNKKVEAYNRCLQG